MGSNLMYLTPRMVRICLLLLISFSWSGNIYCSAALFDNTANSINSIENNGVGASGNVAGSAGVDVNGAGVNINKGVGGSGGFLSNLLGAGTAAGTGAGGAGGAGGSAVQGKGSAAGVPSSGSLDNGISAGGDLHAGGSLDGNLLGLNGHKDVDFNIGGKVGIGNPTDHNQDTVIIFSSPPPTTPAPVTITTTCAPAVTPKPYFPPPPPQHYQSRPISPRFKGHPDC